MSAYALTTKARVKARLQITGTTHDDVIDSIILAVTDRIERMCNRRFMQATHSNEIHDGCDPAYGTGRTTLILRNAPVYTVTSVEYKAGSNSDPDWTAYDEDDYDIDLTTGILYFNTALPYGLRNIRVTYSAGYTGFSIGINNYWVYNATPTGDVGTGNLDFTIPVNASQIIVYADGGRELAANIVFTANTDEFSFVPGRAPFSGISVDYLPSDAAVDGDDDVALPSDLVEACESIVSRTFKRRQADGRASETLGESTVTYTDVVINKEHLAAIKNYRRGYYL